MMWRDTRSRSPLYMDVVFGIGGKAGGKFVIDENDGMSSVVSEQYVDVDYIDGQGGYIFGDI